MIRPLIAALLFVLAGLTLPALAVEPVLGRAFGEEDDPARGGRSVMLTESC